MFESGGRRIKRSLHIDMRTVRFADEELLVRWQKMRLHFALCAWLFCAKSPLSVRATRG